MTNKEITNGLQQLGFDLGWVVTGDEITLWENSEAQPTEAAITEAAKLWDQTQAQIEAEKAIAKQVAQSKLAALGLTTDDLVALGL